jgi:hypothetical protein
VVLAVRIGVMNKNQGLPNVVEENFTNAFSSPKVPSGLEECKGSLLEEGKNGYARAFLSISELRPVVLCCPGI